MSEIDEMFANAINISRKNKTRFSLVTGIVKAINDNDTCIVGEFENVRLNAVINDLDSQFTVYPKLNSEVVIGRIAGKDTMFIVSVSEIEKVVIKIGNQLFEMKDGKFVIKVGEISLKTILNNALLKLKNAIITTPSGPGQFSPADKAAFNQYNNQVNNLLS